MGLVKIGCFRVESDGSDSFVSYDEFRSWDEEVRMKLRNRLRNGTVKLYCACRTDTVNPLTITSLGVIRVASNGQENETTRTTIDELCDRRVLFYRPYLPLENFGDEVPTIVIDRWKEKTLIIDCPDPAFADIHASYGRDNEEFEVRVIREGEDVRAAVASALVKG